jgi:predicted ATPase
MIFRVIAIRPIEDPTAKYTKALQLGCFYRLYSMFNFDGYKDNSNEVIKYNESDEIDLYSFGDTKINICAVAGKNGTGKSTLVELFYALIFLLSKQVELIDESTIRKTHEFTEEEMNRYLSDVSELNKLRVQIFYQFGDSVFRITKSKNVEIDRFDFQIDSTYRFVSKQRVTKNFVKRHFFYSVAINYSLYALNTNECGLWLKPLFHKNDAYQTPLVLNPMRTQGDIDINRVTYLSKNRLLANLLSPVPKQTPLKNSLRSLVNGKVAHSLVFEMDKTKFSKWNTKTRENEVKLEYLDKYADKINLIVNAFAVTEREKKDKEVYLRFLKKATYLEKWTLEYILRKIEKIGRTYNYKGIDREKFNLGRPRFLTTLLNELSNDYSHITFKIRQAINYLRYSKKLNYSDLNKPIHIDLLAKDLQRFILQLQKRKSQDRIKDFKKKEDKGESTLAHDLLIEVQYFNLINFLPPSFLTFDILFENQGSYLQLSSGERQKIYTISSVIYHLVNLNSVVKSKIKYKHVNLIFDEIELYFHPEFQRTFLSDLLDYIQKSGIKVFGMNILFITHSPFILSDIPTTNILFLEKVNDSRFATPAMVQIKTFAANIHELLASGFFMDHTKGAIATTKIEEIVEFHVKVKNAVSSNSGIKQLKQSYQLKQVFYHRLVAQIGEEYLREVLENQISDIESLLGIESKLEQQILSLRKQIDSLEKRKKQFNDKN